MSVVRRPMGDPEADRFRMASAHWQQPPACSSGCRPKPTTRLYVRRRPACQELSRVIGTGRSASSARFEQHDARRRTFPMMQIDLRRVTLMAANGPQRLTRATIRGQQLDQQPDRPMPPQAAVGG